MATGRATNIASTSVTLYIENLSYHPALYNAFSFAIAPLGGSITHWEVGNYQQVSGYGSDYVYKNLSGLNPNTQYIAQLAAQWDGVYYDITNNGFSFTTSGSARPSPFYWTYAKTKGQPFKLTAAEWLSLANNVNAVRTYKGLYPYGFTTESAYIAYGKPVYAWIFNQGVNAIADMKSAGLPSLKSAGDNCNASDFNNLISVLNSIY